MSAKEFDVKGTPRPPKLKRFGVINEWQTILHAGRLCVRYGGLVKKKQGNQERIILFPGFKMGESTMFPLKHYLQKIGYAPEHWGQGTNKGEVEKYRDAMIERLQQDDSGDQVVLVGWSLGGVIAREIARKIPERVNSIFIFGSPIKGPKYTIAAGAFNPEETKRITELLEQQELNSPIQVPSTIVFTKKDSIVSWPSCIDQTSTKARHFEVKSTHLSLGIDPQVWQLLSSHLQEHLNT